MSAVTLASLHVGRAGGSVVLRQLIWFLIGLIALILLGSLDYRRLVRAAPAIYLLGLMGLAAVFVLGRTVSGARRWVVFGPLSIQPSEIFKVCFLLMVVWAITSRWAQPVGKTTLALTLPILAGPIVLIIKQPDLGTAILLVPVLGGVGIAASARDPVGRLLALGATTLIAAQVLINVGMVTGLLPVVGIPLPMMSYGGSSMVASFMTLGLLLSVRMRQFQ